jgi:hypothetical protein
MAKTYSSESNIYNHIYLSELANTANQNNDNYSFNHNYHILII